MTQVVLTHKDKEKPEGYRRYQIKNIPRASIEVNATYKGDGSSKTTGGEVTVYIDNAYVPSLSKEEDGKLKTYKAAVNYAKKISKKLTNIKLRKLYENVHTREYKAPH